MQELAGKVAVITGGGSGSGLAMGHRFAAEGMAVVLADIDEDDIAAKVVEGVKANQFYILTHRGILPIIKHRHEDIEELRNPSVDQGL